MNPVLLDLGIIKIYWYSLFIFMALLVGGILVLIESKRFNISLLTGFFALVEVKSLGLISILYNVYNK